MAPSQNEVLQTSNCSLLLIYLPQKDEKLSRPGWLTYSGRFTDIPGHPSAVGRPQDRESSPVKDQRSTTVPRNQHISPITYLQRLKVLSELLFLLLYWDWRTDYSYWWKFEFINKLVIYQQWYKTETHMMCSTYTKSSMICWILILPNIRISLKFNKKFTNGTMWQSFQLNTHVHRMCIVSKYFAFMYAKCHRSGS